MKALALVGACVLGMGLLVPAATADTILVSGTGSQNSNSFRFDISGDDFVYRVSTSEGPLVVGVCPNPGEACEIERSYTAGVLPLSQQFSTLASLGDIATNLVTGRLVVVGTVTPPATVGDFTATIPIAFAGEVSGHQPPAQGSSETPVAFDVALGAVGTANLRGVVTESSGAVINAATFDFSGTGLTDPAVPEPGAVFLAAGGIGLLALLFRRRRAMLN